MSFPSRFLHLHRHRGDTLIGEGGLIPADIPALLALSIVLLVIFFFWSRHLELHTTYPPIVKPSMFTRHGGKITATCLASFFACFSIYGWVYVTTIFYQSYKGLSALDNAVRMLTANIVGLLAAGAVMFLAPRFHAGLLIAIGGLLGGHVFIIVVSANRQSIKCALRHYARKHYLLVLRVRSANTPPVRH